MNDTTSTETKSIAKKVSPVSLLAGVAALSVGIALLAIFALASWAEASVLNHGIQHVLIFLSGLGFGTSMLAVYVAKGDKNEG